MTDNKNPDTQAPQNIQQWLDAYQANQQEIVKAHQSYQDALKEGLEVFLEAMTQTQVGLARVITHIQGQLTPEFKSQPVQAPSSTPLAQPAPGAATENTVQQSQLAQDLLATVALKTGYPQEMLALDMSLERDLGVDSIKRVEILSALRDQHPSLPEVDADVMAHIETLSDVVQHLNATASVQSTIQNTAQRTTQPPVENGHGSALNTADLTAILLDTVANKTGYPQDMLSLDMALEEDLGIDSIKRVEIFSTLRERTPNLPEVDTNHMAQLQTLGDIVNFMRSTLAATAPNFF